MNRHRCSPGHYAGIWAASYVVPLAVLVWPFRLGLGNWAWFIEAPLLVLVLSVVVTARHSQTHIPRSMRTPAARPAPAVRPTGTIPLRAAPGPRDWTPPSPPGQA